MGGDNIILPTRKYAITGIISLNIPFLWKFVWPLLQPAVKRSGELDEDAVLRDLQNGTKALWVVVKDDDEIIAAVVTSIEEFPLKVVCNIVYCGGGEVVKWAKQFFEIFEPWAIRQGADEIRFGGRFGWERVLGKYGYCRDSVLMSKKVSESRLADYLH